MIVNSKKKGFTLVELLGVIVILLLLATIVTPIFVNYIRKSRDDAYDTQINTIKQSAKNWAAAKENIKYLPIKDGECIEVTLERLKDNGYLDYNIKNPNTEEKFPDDMKVVIRKQGKKMEYIVNDKGNVSCDSGIIITSEYPKWVFVSSSPTKVTKGSSVTVLIQSDRKIINNNTQKEDIVVKVGNNIIENAISNITCTNGDLLNCELTITNLKGVGKLSLVIDKETIQDEDGNYSKKQNIMTNTSVDSEGPKIVYVGRSNTNSSLYFATKDDTVTIKFKVEDKNITSSLTANDILVYIDGNSVNATKTLNTTESSSKIEYSLKLENINESGKVSIKIPEGKIEDELGNINAEKIIAPGIEYDNVLPEINLTPNERADSYSDIDVKVTALDNGSGINDNTLRYVYSKDNTATPNRIVSNGGIVSLSNEDGSWYLVVKVCDIAGNCNTKTSGIYNLNSSGPTITISPNGNSDYEKGTEVSINVTSNGAEIDESSLSYSVSKDVGAETGQIFELGQKISIGSLTGEYYVIAKACDEQGNCSRKVSNAFLFDNEIPTIEFSENGTTGYVKEKTITVRATDNVVLADAKYIISTSKIDTPIITFNGEADIELPSISGTYYIIVKACDQLDNCNMTASLPFYIDVEDPKISVLVDGLDADIAITDNVELAGYKITNTTDIPTSWDVATGNSLDLTFSADSTSVYYVHAIDGVGNTSYEIMEFENQSCDVELDEYWEFPYSNTPQPWTVPTTGVYQLEVWGAQGGKCRNWRDNSGYTEHVGGKGGYSSGMVHLTAGETIYIVTGGQPAIKNIGNGGNKNTITAGYNGGGAGTYGGGIDAGGAGGGATHIGTFNSTLVDHGSTTGLYIVAGGGGGGSGGFGVGPYEGGTGGGTSGGNSTTTAYGTATGGSQTAGGTPNGSFGQGSNSGNAGGGSGGGGLYGGGGGSYYTPGGGGSGYIGGVTDGIMSNGIQTGSGKAKITLKEVQGCDKGDTVWDYPYTSYEIPYIFKAPRDGIYKLEVWGAQSGDTTTVKGAKGGYSSGTVELSKDDKLFVVVGGQGENSWAAYNQQQSGGIAKGGYNGGGNGRGNSDQNNNTGGGGGGGATHIAAVTGTLKDIGASNLDKIYIVAGGGGSVVETVGSGRYVFCTSGVGGGETGGNGSADSFGGTYNRTPGSGASQSSGYSFGQGGQYAGGGLYGGYGGNGSSWWEGNTVQEGGHAEGWCTGAGGGSGYIGGVSNGTTLAGSTSFPSPSGGNETGHEGAGFARITYISE